MTLKERKAVDLERLCSNCNYGFPAEPGDSEFAVCLHDREFEPYLDDILERQDFSRCQQLVMRKLFGWDQEACTEFDPVEDLGIECSPEVVAKIGVLAEQGALTSEALEGLLLADQIDWGRVPVDSYVDKLGRAVTADQLDPVLNQLGALVANGNRAAFDALCDFFRSLEPPATLTQSHTKRTLLNQLGHRLEYREELAELLVDDLFRTPSNPQTRSWYTEVLRFFEYSSPALAQRHLGRILDSPHFSYRIKRRVREIIDRSE